MSSPGCQEFAQPQRGADRGADHGGSQGKGRLLFSFTGNPPWPMRNLEWWLLRNAQDRGKMLKCAALEIVGNFSERAGLICRLSQEEHAQDSKGELCTRQEVLEKRKLGCCAYESTEYGVPR